MSLVWLLVLGGVLYVAMQYLSTFQQMVRELNQMRSQCMKGGVSDESLRKNTGVMESMSDLKKSLLTALTHMKSNV